MKFADVIDKAIENKSKVFVNGIPDEEGCTIIKREEDYIVIEIKNIKEKQEESTVERPMIPINQIFSLSQGEKKIGTLESSVSKAK